MAHITHVARRLSRGLHQYNMASHRSNSQEGTRRNPSRLSRHSGLTGPERANAEYRAASTHSQHRAESVPPVTRVNTGEVQSPQARRSAPPMAVPGAFENSGDQTTIENTGVTMENIPDPEEPTIRGQQNLPEPGDTFSAPSPVPTRPSALPIPTFGREGHTTPSETRSSGNYHRLIGGHIPRVPVQGYTGVHMVGPGSLSSRQHTPSSTAPTGDSIFARSRRQSPDRAVLATPSAVSEIEQIRTPGGHFEQAVPEYPGPPPSSSSSSSSSSSENREPPQGNPRLVQHFERLLQEMEENLRNEIGIRTNPITPINQTVNGLLDVTAHLRDQTNAIVRQLNIHSQETRAVGTSAELARGNTQELRGEMRNLDLNIQRIHTEINYIRRTQEAQTHNQNEILRNIRENNERLETLNILYQELEEQSARGPVRGRSPSERRSPSFVRVGHSTERRHRRADPSPSPVRPRIPKEARVQCPDPFNGKKGTEAETFMLCLELYFNEYHEVYENNDRRKINKLLTTMKEGTNASSTLR